MKSLLLLLLCATPVLAEFTRIAGTGGPEIVISQPGATPIQAPVGKPTSFTQSDGRGGIVTVEEADGKRRVTVSTDRGADVEILGLRVSLHPNGKWQAALLDGDQVSVQWSQAAVERASVTKGEASRLLKPSPVEPVSFSPPGARPPNPALPPQSSWILVAAEGARSMPLVPGQDVRQSLLAAGITPEILARSNVLLRRGGASSHGDLSSLPQTGDIWTLISK
jgi:hypothetical protein